jgi:peptidylprolyl isomerase
MKKIVIIILVLVCIGVGIYFVNRNYQKKLQIQIIGPAPTETIPETKKDPITNNKEDNKKIMYATMHTNMGDITIELNKETPNTVANFTKLAGEGFYNGTKFHRVIQGFMNQAGDPLSKDDAKKSMWGTGGPGYKFNDEITATNHNNVGTIAMANAGPNTNGSQFFINVAPNNFLDTKHTVFGHVTSGMDVVTAINNTATDPSDKPLTPVVIESITLK